MLTMDTLKRFPIAILCTLTVLLSFAAYFTPIPREALPFVFVLIPTLVAIALVAVTEGKVSVRALLGQMGTLAREHQVGRGRVGPGAGGSPDGGYGIWTQEVQPGRDLPGNGRRRKLEMATVARKETLNVKEPLQLVAAAAGKDIRKCQPRFLMMNAADRA